MKLVKFAAVATDTTGRVGGGINATAIGWTGRTAHLNYFSEVLETLASAVLPFVLTGMATGMSLR